MSNAVLMENRLRQKITLLEDSLAKIAAVRKELKENVDFAKEEIRESCSHQLDSLRAREQVLVSQCETLLCTKDDILSKQQNQLHEVLGACRQSLENLLAITRETKAVVAAMGEVSGIEEQVDELLNSLSSLDLAPREAPGVEVEIDSYALRKALQSFGRVFVKVVNFGKEQQSLPFGMEDYDEDTNHLMYKSIDKPFEVAIKLPSKAPALSCNTSDWLFKEALTCSADGHVLPIEKPSQITHLRSTPSPGRVSVASGFGGSHQLNGWLQQIKAHVETEPNVFESFQIPKVDIDMDNECMKTLFSDYFQQVFSSPTNNWLLNNNIDWATTPYAIWKYFAEASMESSAKWLLEANQPAVSTASSSSGAESDIDLCDGISIESLDHLTSCIGSTPRMNGSPVNGGMGGGGCAFVVPPPDISKICRANETCNSFNECICDNNCATVWYRNWLLTKGVNSSGCCGRRKSLHVIQPPTIVTAESEDFETFRKHLWMQPSTQWLLNRNSEKNSFEFMDYWKQQWDKNVDYQWLMNPGAKGTVTENIADLDLQQKIADALGWDKLLDQLSAVDLSYWLPPSQQWKDAEKKEQEKTGYGFNTELFEPTADLKSWLVEDHNTNTNFNMDCSVLAEAMP